jgi:hypothetical protein
MIYVMEREACPQLGGAAALIISWITVSHHSIKAALLNPTTALRDE